MSSYRRARVPGGTYFFTVVTWQRHHIFTSEEAVALLRAAFHKVKAQRPFTVEAMVVLPDHLHCIWRLPRGDSDYSSRWREIKKSTTRAFAMQPGASSERKIWQNRFWEHVIRDEDDWRQHLEYIHYNPVKHGHATRPIDWPWSSFSRFVERGWYDVNWGTVEPEDIRGMNFE